MKSYSKSLINNLFLSLRQERDASGLVNASHYASKKFLNLEIDSSYKLTYRVTVCQIVLLRFDKLPINPSKSFISFQRDLLTGS